MMDAAFFNKIYLFQDLEEPELQQVLSRTVQRDFAAGEIVIHEGDPGDSLFIMAAGEVQITKQLTLVLDEDTPKERVFIRLKAEQGVFFGEMALVTGRTRSASVNAPQDPYSRALHISSRPPA